MINTVSVIAAHVSGPVDLIVNRPAEYAEKVTQTAKGLYIDAPIALGTTVVNLGKTVGSEAVQFATDPLDTSIRYGKIAIGLADTVADAVYHYDQTWDSIEETASSLPKTIDDWIVHTPLDKQGQFFGEIGLEILIGRATEVAFTRVLSAARRIDDVVPDTRGPAPSGGLLTSRTGGSRFNGNIDDVIEDLGEIVPGIRHKFDDLGDPKLAGVFDDADNIIRFSDDVELGVVTLADEMQHALDLAQTGLTKSDMIKEIIHTHKIGPNAAYGWYHRRIFTRAIKNIHEGKPGFRHLKDHLGEIYDAYLGHGGELTLKQILETSFDGLF